MARLLRALRVLVGGVLAGVVGGAVAGAGARLAMYVVRLMNPTRNGQVTHANAEVGQFTLSGTVALISEGAFYGLSGGILYLLVRRWLPGRGLGKGLWYGLLLLVVAAPVLLDGNYEFFRYVPPQVSVALFALLYPLYGAVVGPLAERIGGGPTGQPRNPAVRWSGYAVLAVVVGWSLLRDYILLRDVFHIVG